MSTLGTKSVYFEDEKGKKQSYLAKVRKSKGFTQEEIAGKLYITLRQYGNYERDPTKIPVEHLITLRNLYGVSIDYLLGQDDCTEVDNEYIKAKLNLSDESLQHITDLRNYNYSLQYLFNKLLGVLDPRIFDRLLLHIKDYIYTDGYIPLYDNGNGELVPFGYKSGEKFTRWKRDNEYEFYMTSANMEGETHIEKDNYSVKAMKMDKAFLEARAYNLIKDDLNDIRDDFMRKHIYEM